MGNLLYHPLIVFALCFLATACIYLIGQRIAAPGTPSAGKGEVYACGENAEAVMRPSYGWYHIAFVFTLLDIAVLMIATMPHGVGLPLAIAWIVGGIAAIIMLFKD